APATANIIAKFANGIADDLLSTTYLSVSCPVLIAPAMNPSMWSHPATAHNVQILISRGVSFVGPEAGTVACGDMGKGKMSDPEVIYERALSVIGA
ncbi:MAG TPA: flavoprotein, partial [Spirochaetota bacterium]